MARILVIDDEISVRLTIQAILKRRGHNVVLAATEAFSFDVIFVDIFMPGMNGLNTIKALRLSAPHVPVIVISGYLFREGLGGVPDFLRMALSLGATSYLQKPFKPWQIIKAVEIACCTVQSAQEA